MAKRYWLMKSEPDAFGIADLARVNVEPWTGVRNYMARNHMRAMSVDDAVLFHHSNATPPGVAGLARVVRTGVVDATQFDPDSKYYDAKAKQDAPTWDCVDVGYVETFPYLVSMDRLRAEPALADMLVLQRGMRLSVQPVTQAHYETIARLGHTPPEDDAPVAKPATAKKPVAKAAAKKPAARAAAKAAAAKVAKPSGAKASGAKSAAKSAKSAKTLAAASSAPAARKKPTKR